MSPATATVTPLNPKQGQGNVALEINMGEIDADQFKIIKRSGELTQFQPEKIEAAIFKAFLDVKGQDVGNASSTRGLVRQLRDQVIAVLWQRRRSGGNMSVNIEEIQDVVEMVLMKSEEHQVARAYILYRESRAKARRENQAEGDTQRRVHVIDDAGDRIEMPEKKLRDLVRAACEKIDHVDPAKIVEIALRDLYEGVSISDVRKALVLASRTLIEAEPNYNFVTARLLMHTIRAEVLGYEVSHKDMRTEYPAYFPNYIKKGIEAELLDPKLAEYDLEALGRALVANRDLQFGYLGLQTLYDRYFLHVDGRRIELPQVFFMRVAMGLALNEKDREARAIEFYNVLSSFDFMSSTPTLFNSGTRHSQLSSCYLTTIADDLDGIYEGIKENALLSKFAGGLGNDWTNVRSMGSHIKGTNGKSQGVVPFLKVVNDTAVAVNQGGKRKGAVCAYLETWHMDIEEFLELRKNTGDERRRTHDMNTANWIPDLFMKRVMADEEWTLLSPSNFPDLHEKYGREFEKAYLAAEAAVARGEVKVFKKVRAVQLWRKMLSMLFETGHPWITFKDACNVRSPQNHVGVVHSSNLCTEITLNTGPDEIAVCNLGSVNLTRHLKDGKIDHEKLEATVDVAMRMLDNVIDINFYPVGKAKTSNSRHRPVGLGIMGFQDCLHMLKLPYASEGAVNFADESMEAVCYYAYKASSKLASERGAYSSFKGSLWSKGIMPHDTMRLLREERGGNLDCNDSVRMNWDALRQMIQAQGIRNSNCVAIAPTATISNIVGVSASIEPTYQNVFVKSNLSGEFTIINEFLVEDLKKLGLWDEVMIADIKYFDGSIASCNRVPDDLKALYATAFEMDPVWIIEAGSRRSKWIDQSQSLNLYVANASGKKLDEIYKLAWLRGLKTTYYLRTLGATSAEKSTGRIGQLNAVAAETRTQDAPKACSIDNPDCEACQ